MGEWVVGCAPLLLLWFKRSYCNGSNNYENKTIAHLIVCSFVGPFSKLHKNVTIITLIKAAKVDEK